MSLADIRTAIIDDLKASGLGDAVEPHPGRLALDDLGMFIIKGRAAIRVGCLGVTSAEKTDIGVDIETAWAAYVMTQDKSGFSKDESAMILSSAICKRIAGNLWNRDDLDSPYAIRADNLYSGSLERNKAIALWAVTWRQVWMPEDIDLSSIDDLLNVVTHFDVDLTGDGEPVLIDTTELEGGSL